MDAEFRTESYDPDNLIAGHKPSAKAIPIILLSGENVVRGEVLGRDGDGKYLASLSAAIDGSEVPRAIAAADIDATLADAKGLAYVEGEFNEDKITLGTAHTVASIKAGLQDFNIYLVPPVTATPA
jgi:hypothetical protein